MVVYNLNLLVVYVFSLLSRAPVKIDGVAEQRKPFAIVTAIPFLSLWLVAGLRYGTGADYWTYVVHFYRVDMVETTLEPGREVGYTSLIQLVRLFTDDAQAFFLVTSFMILVLFVLGMRRQARRLELSMFLFVCGFSYYSSLNVVRQYIAIALFFYAIQYLSSRQPLKYALMIGLATAFHFTAIILLPLYVFVHRPMGKFAITVVAIVIAGLYWQYDLVSDLLLGLSPYEEAYTATKYVSEGAKVWHALVPGAIVLVAFLLLRKLNAADARNTVYTNLMLLALLFNVLSLGGMGFARIALYFGTANIFLVPNFLDVVPAQLRPYAYLLVVVLFYLYSYVLLTAGQAGVLPYAFMWLGGEVVTIP